MDLTLFMARSTDFHGSLKQLPPFPSVSGIKTLTAAEASYRQSALELGYSDSEVRDWVTAIMFSLRTHVLGRQSSEEKPSAESLAVNFSSAA